MSSASSPVRRPAAASPNVVNAAARSPARSTAAAPSGQTTHGGLDAADIPPLDTNLDIDGLKPTLLSRLFDLFSPKR
jgi:hypothetical protein